MAFVTALALVLQKVFIVTIYVCICLYICILQYKCAVYICFLHVVFFMAEQTFVMECCLIKLLPFL